MNVLSRLRAKFPVLVPSKVKAEVRVAIAQDVIDILKFGRMTVKSGYGYFELDGYVDGMEDSYEAVALSMRQPRGKTRCIVCALGAAALCAVGLYDEVGEDKGEYTESEEMRDILAKWFSRKQLDLIECAFERNSEFSIGKSALSVRERAAAFGRGYEDDTERLEAIMNNIVRNEGSFRL